MTSEDVPEAAEGELTGKDDAISLLTEGLGVSLLSGVGLIPLILPGHNGESKFLLSKLQIQGVEEELVYEGLVPLDVVMSFALNLIKACHTAFRNVGEVKDENLMFVEIDDLRKSLTECIGEINSLAKILSEGR